MAKSTWNELTAKQYIGDFTGSYFGYSLIDSIRNNAASGGIVSTILIDAFRQNIIDGALLCRSTIENNSVHADYFIATQEEEIFQSQGSKYIATRFASRAVPLIREFSGRLAVVCLPCDALILNNLRKKDKNLDQKLLLIMTLFCGHSSEKDLTQLVLNKLNPEKKEIKDFRYRIGHWRGNLKVDFSDGSSEIKPFSYFSDYQNLFFYCEPKCLQCNDQTGFYSDISIGDIWSMKMKANPIKHNAIIVRSEAGKAALTRIESNGLAKIFPVSIGELSAGQSRSLPLHANVNARVWAAKHFNINLKPISSDKPSLLDKAIAWIILLNYSFSHSTLGKKVIPALPRPAIKLYLYAFKGLQVMQKPKRIVHTIGIIGGSVWGNRGAESMLVTTVAKLKEKNPEADFVVFSIYPKKDRQLINDPKIKVISSKPLALLINYFPFALLYWLFSRIGIKIWIPSALRRLKQCHVLYDIGGITFADRGLVLLYNVFTLLPALLLGIPVTKLSQAVGPFRSFWNRLFAKVFLGKCQSVYTRGQISQEFLEGLGAKNITSSIAADIAFLFESDYSLSNENAEKVNQLEGRLDSLRNAGKTIVLFSPSSVVLKKFESPIYENLILDAIEKIDNPSFHYVFLPNSNRAGSDKSQNNDIYVINLIRNLALARFDGDITSRIDWIDWDLNTKGIREIMQHANIVITSRFHSMVSALSLTVPVYVIGWSHKYQEVLQMFNLQENAIDFSRANGESLSKEILRILSSQEEIRSQIKFHLPLVKESAQHQFDELDVMFD